MDVRAVDRGDAPPGVGDDVWDYLIDGGASGETNRHNRRALDALRLVPRVLGGVGAASASSALLGRAVAAPIVVAPMAAQRLVHPDGELAVARAAAAVGVPMILSTSSTTPVEDVASVDGLDLWFQLYPFEDSSATAALVDRAVLAGARVLVVTVDMAPPGFGAPIGRGVPLPVGAGYAHHGAAPVVSSTFDWRELEDLVATVPVPVVVKGVLHADDAARVRQLGAAGVVVSNHGGRVLDGLVAAVDALADLPPRSDGDGLRLVDGAISCGIDVVRALAVGADGVLVGRPLLRALVSEGERGAERWLAALVAEMEMALAVIGAPDPAHVTAGHLRRG